MDDGSERGATPLSAAVIGKIPFDDAYKEQAVPSPAQLGSQTVMPSVPKRVVTVAPLPSARHLQFRSGTWAAAVTLAQVMRFLGGRRQARDGVAGF